MNFASAEAYKRWLAYGHMHKLFEKAAGNQPVSIRGQPKKVEHSENKKK